MSTPAPGAYPGYAAYPPPSEARLGAATKAFIAAIGLIAVGALAIAVYLWTNNPNKALKSTISSANSAQSTLQGAISNAQTTIASLNSASSKSNITTLSADVAANTKAIAALPNLTDGTGVIKVAQVATPVLNLQGAGVPTDNTQGFMYYQDNKVFFNYGSLGIRSLKTLSS